jgi:2-keto-4-pentenoate hydratase/2-oxohepta-3-ene-1,7-dioic acid hydratase in catechol pathway
MSHDRRTFLKATGLAGAAVVSGAAAAGLARPLPANAQASGGAGGAPQELPKGMIFATLRRDDGLHGLGIKTDRGILDVVRAEQDLHENAPTTIDDVLRGRGDLGGLRRLVDKARASAAADRYFVAEKAAAFGPCVTNPEKIICIGLNYRKHAAETGNPVPPVPILFNKYNTALNSHGGAIAVSKENAERFDYEAELVIVMGRTARNVEETDALNYVFGYCTGNDFTARDLQSRTSQWMLGKSGDGYAPVGPWLVTADQVDPNNLKIELQVNDESKPRQSSNTSDMVFNCQKLISYISKHMTLKPGDIIFTGTPEGVIAGYPKEKQVWLKPGDRLVTSIEKLGDLEFMLT